MSNSSFQLLVFADDSWVTLLEEPVNDFREASDLLITHLINAGMEFGDIMTVMDRWFSAREADTCVCQREGCGNVIYPFDSFLGIPAAYAFYA